MSSVEVKGTLVRLAATYQRQAETCKRLMQDELVMPAVLWYFRGLADAHTLDAAQARELAEQTVMEKPPEDGGLVVEAYGAVLRMLTYRGSSTSSGRGNGSGVVEGEDGHG